jgi:hypothetical protein
MDGIDGLGKFGSGAICSRRDDQVERISKLN